MIREARLSEAFRPTPAQVAEFEDRGLLTVPNALPPTMVGLLLEAHDRIYGEEQAAGRLGPDGRLHLFAFVLRDERYLDLLDLPATFPLICELLGWNIYVYHCHLDVHPPVRDPASPGWGWHQDGGRQNLEIETHPTRPRLSVKVAYFLSDASEPGRGNLMVIPGSHRWNSIPRPERPDLGFEQPPGAAPVVAAPGTAVLFDRRLWHSRSDNLSNVTRKVLFLGYTYRWVRPRDDYRFDPQWLAGLSPIRRQLLGMGPDAMSYWGLGEEEAALKASLRRWGLLDPSLPSHR